MSVCEVISRPPALPPVLDLESRLAREQARAEAAEARIAGLEAELLQARADAERRKWESAEARNKLNSLRATFETNRAKLAAAREELKETRASQASRNVRRLAKKVVHLEALLKQAGIDGGRGHATILRRRISRLKDKVAAQEEEIKELRAEREKLRSARATHAKARFGKTSEKQKKTGTAAGKRGQRKGKPGHGRTKRPALELQAESHDPPPQDRSCSCCGLPYVKNGSHVSGIIEIHVKAHTRLIHRNRWRRGCECPSSPQEVAAPPPARLFANTPYGVSVWSLYLYERFGCCRPLRRVAEWMTDQGLAVSAGTLADATPRLVPLFEPISQAIHDHLLAEEMLHGDETGWRVSALDAIRGTSRSWLWSAASRDAVWFRVDARRSAKAAARIFAGIRPGTILVCDAYSAYKKLVRELEDLLILAWCWAHLRRHFIKAAAGNAGLDTWRDRWLVRIGRIYHLNEVRLKHWDREAAMDAQSRKFVIVQRQLERALARLFALAQKELAGPAGSDRRAKPLASLIRHRQGLSVFLGRPEVPMDNNLIERLQRRAVIGRKLSFGSDSLEGAAFSATMYGIFGTLRMNGICIRSWLDDWLAACAMNGGAPPDDLSPWLPWSMDPDRRRALAAG